MRRSPQVLAIDGGSPGSPAARSGGIAGGAASEAGFTLPAGIDAQQLSEALGRDYDAFVLGGLGALAHGDHNRRWVQFGLMPQENSGHAAHSLLQELAGKLLRAGDIDNFFYMHKPPGLRVRFETAPDRRGQVAELVEAELATWQCLADVRRGRYEPEEHLFGGPASMAHVHRLFTVDSQGWLAYFGLAESRPRWMFSLMLVREMLNGLAISGWEDLSVWERIRRQAYREIPEALDRDKVSAVTSVMRALWADPGALRQELGEHASNLAEEYGTRIRGCAQRWDAACFATGDCLIGPCEAAAFATIFHWNRGRLSAMTQALIATALSDRSARP